MSLVGGPARGAYRLGQRISNLAGLGWGHAGDLQAGGLQARTTDFGHGWTLTWLGASWLGQRISDLVKHQPGWGLTGTLGA